MTRIHAWWWGRVPSRCRSLCFNSPLVMLHVSVKLMQPHSSQEEWGGWRKNKYASSTTSVFSFPCQEYVWGTGSLNLPPKLSLHHCWRTDGRGLVAVELSTAAARRHLMVDLLFCWIPPSLQHLQYSVEPVIPGTEGLPSPPKNV